MGCKCCISWNCMTLEQKICYICDYEYEYFLNKSNIVGVGLGYEVKNGFYTENKCIKVFTIKKIPENKMSVQDLIPKIYKGIKTDVVESGKSTLFALNKRIRPVLCGYSIAAIDSEELGTLGCLVTDGHDNYLLSNNHILADLNRLPLYITQITEPAESDGGDPSKDVIAVLSKYIPIKFTSMLKGATNYVDCAMAKVIDKAMVVPDIAFIGKPKLPKAAKLKIEVKKVGCITEETRGTIIAVNTTELLEIDEKRDALFKKQIVTTSMGGSGDSGAVMVDDKNYVIGLLMGGSDSHTIYNDINYVLKALNVRIVTN